VNKQESIEMQQRLELEQKKQESVVQAEIENKKYFASRKNDCLKIYNTENDKWNNIEGWRYSEKDDLCYIAYKDGEDMTDLECDTKFPTDSDFGRVLFARDNILCKDGKFENSF
jgi:hypothetical protein